MKPSRRKRNRTPREIDSPPKNGSAHEERMLDDALEDTFPASDPPAQTQPHDTSPGSRDDPEKTPGKKPEGER